MNVWKVILATLVIYSAGLITGGLLVRPPFRPFPGPPPPAQAGPMPWYLQERFLERMRMELDLTPEQTTRLGRVFAESRERMRIINDLVRPEMQEEMRHTRERVVAELTPPQRQRFEELMRARANRPGEPPRRVRPRDQGLHSRPGSSNPPAQ